jgi:hypothetical protein
MRKHLGLSLLVLVGLAGIFFFFYYFGRKDAQALESFIASYEEFDSAISDFSVNGADLEETKAVEALTRLQAKAVFRLSSLTKNDGELMSQAREITALSGKELESLRAYQRAARSQNADRDRLAEERGLLSGKRKAAYARFRQLGGLKKETEDRGSF